jgi:hypothetical protein
MVKDRPIATGVLKLTYYAAMACGAAGAWLVGIDSAALARYGPVVGALAGPVRSNQLVVAIFPPIAALAKALLDRFSVERLHHVIHHVLTDYRRRLFDGLPGATHHHRVTLFVHKKWAFVGTWPWRRKRWPGSGWLVPVTRSDHTTQRVRARFLAPDHADRCEGLAGSTWSARATLTIEQLPMLTKTSAEADIKSYADRTKCDVDWLRQRLREGETLPRALRGFPIEVNGELWGVVVIDSREESPFGEDPKGNASFTLIFLSTISRLVEGARL